MLVREAKVHQEDPAALLTHHVAGFDVSMEKSRGVHRAGRAADVDADHRRLARAHRALRRDQIRQRLPLDEIAPEAEAPVVAIHAVDRDDVRVAHARDRSRFTQQRSEFFVPIAVAWQEELQRDVALKRGIERAIHLAERAAADALQVLERPPPVQRIGHGAAGESRFDLGFVQRDTVSSDRGTGECDAGRFHPAYECDLSSRQ